MAQVGIQVAFFRNGSPSTQMLYLQSNLSHISNVTKNGQFIFNFNVLLMTETNFKHFQIDFCEET